MTLRPIKGFPLADDYATTRVPNAVLGRVLSSVDDPNVVKLVLRAVWLLERQNGYPRFIASEQLRSDRVLSVIFGDAETFERTLEDVVALGVLARVSVNGVERLMLNTESARRTSVEMMGGEVVQEEDDDSDGWDAPAERSMPANAFRAYEDNIGMLSPMIRESILSSLEDFTDDEITRAIRIAVENESRSWSYVSAILRRWRNKGVPSEQRSEQLEGRTDERDVSEVELNRYIEYLRRQQQRSSDQS